MPEQTDPAFSSHTSGVFVPDDPKNKTQGSTLNPFEKISSGATPGTFTPTTSVGKKGQSTWETHPLTKGGHFYVGKGPTVGGTEMVRRPKENNIEKGRRLSLQQTLARIDVRREELIATLKYIEDKDTQKELESIEQRIDSLTKVSLDTKQIVTDENINDARSVEVRLREVVDILKNSYEEQIIEGVEKLTKYKVTTETLLDGFIGLVSSGVIPSSLEHQKQATIEAFEKLQWLTSGNVRNIAIQGNDSIETLDEDLNNAKKAFTTLQEAIKLQPYRDIYDNLESRFLTLQQTKQALVAPLLSQLRSSFANLSYLSNGSTDQAEEEQIIKQKLTELTREIETLENDTPKVAVANTVVGPATTPATPDNEPQDPKARVIATSNMILEGHKKGKKFTGYERIIGINGQDGKPLSKQEYDRDWRPAVSALIRFRDFLNSGDNIHIFGKGLAPLKNNLLQAIEAFDLEETKAKTEILWMALNEAEKGLSIDYEKNQKIIQDLDILTLPGKNAPYPDSVTPVAVRSNKAGWEKIDARTGRWEKLTDEESAIMDGPVQKAFTLFRSDRNFEVRGDVEKKNEILNHVNHRRFAEAQIAAEEFIEEFKPLFTLNSQDELPDEYNPKKIERDTLLEVVRWPRSVTLTETKGQTRKNRQTGKDETIRKSWSITVGGKTQQISQEEFDQWNNFKEKTFKDAINAFDAFLGQTDRRRKVEISKDLFTLNKEIVDAVRSGDLELAASRLSRLPVALTDAENRWKEMKQVSDLLETRQLLDEARILLAKTENLYNVDTLAKIRFELKEFEIRERELKTSNKKGKEGASALKGAITEYIASLKKKEGDNRLSSEFLIVDVEAALKTLDSEKKAVISLIGTTGTNNDLEIVQIRERIKRLTEHAGTLKTKGEGGKLKDKEVEMLKREVAELSEILRKKENKTALIYGSTVLRPKAGGVIRLSGGRTMPVEQWQEEQNIKQARKESLRDEQRRMDHATLRTHHERMFHNDREGYLKMYAIQELDRDNPHTAVAQSLLIPIIDAELDAKLKNESPEQVERIRKGIRVRDSILSELSDTLRKSYTLDKLRKRDALLLGIKNLNKENATTLEVQRRAEMEEAIADIDRKLGLLNSTISDNEVAEAIEKRNDPLVLHKQTYYPGKLPKKTFFSFLKPGYHRHNKLINNLAKSDKERAENPEGTYTPTELDRVRLKSIQQARNEKREKVAVGTDDPRPDPLFGADPFTPGEPPVGGAGPQPRGPDTPHNPDAGVDDPFEPDMAGFANTDQMVYDDKFDNEREQPVRPSSPESNEDRKARVGKLLQTLAKHLTPKDRADWRYYAKAFVVGTILAAAATVRASTGEKSDRPRTIQEAIMNAPSWREEFERLNPEGASILLSFPPSKPISFDDLLTQYLTHLPLSNPATREKITNLNIAKLLNERGAGAGLNDDEQKELSNLTSLLMRTRYIADLFGEPNARTINTIVGPKEYGDYDYTNVTLQNLYDIALQSMARGDHAYATRISKKTI